jgi:dTDP-4-dehydrorhamnose reductase
MSAADDLELWGGHECTVNRVGDAYMDQTVLSGHQYRLDDLDRFAALGIRALRYPVLWERVSPVRPDWSDWSWSDERLGRLRELGVRPIVGLTHHGSGPRYTDLMNPGFAPGLAAHAAATARRYPWVEDWTPVNEPLTTARFSALYGLWYPHLKDERAFWTALVNQVDAVRLSMKAIREVNPAARLIQTEDLGKVYSTARLAEQAAYENHRRWMTWDLLTGRVKPGHPLWPRLMRFGLRDRLSAIADEPCPPDIVGVNHYVTSDRFLDDRLARYPSERHGGSDQLRYADVEAVRVLKDAPRGLALALEEAWERYRLPVAVTECHLGCTRDEQVRWLKDAWRTVQEARQGGADVRALTAWSLLGAHDWDSLLTEPRGRYEVGVFDVRSGTPRPTVVARFLSSLNEAAIVDPVSDGLGWWRRDVRLEFKPSASACRTALLRGSDMNLSAARPLLIVGATGTLGQAMARHCRLRGLSHVLTDRKALDLQYARSIAAALDRHDPWAVVNAAGWVRVDDAEGDADACLAANAHGAAALALACAQRDLPLASFSSDLVFDGSESRPYRESDTPRPLNVYGRSKAEMERAVLAAGDRNLVIRTSAFFSPHDPHNFAHAVVETLSRGDTFVAADDLWISPTYVPDLVNATLDLLIDGEAGLWHLANQGGLTWCDFAGRIAQACDLDPALVQGRPAAELGFVARRPARVMLESDRGVLLAPLDDAILRFARAFTDRTATPRRRQTAA